MTALRLRAAWLVSGAGDPVADAEVVLEGGRIAYAGPACGGAVGDRRDLGDVVLVPGLVNAHTHLDYTVLRGLVEDLPFLPWVRTLNDRKASLDDEDWLASATWGAMEAVSGGITAIGDCTDAGGAYRAAAELGLGGVVYQEVFGIDGSRTPDQVVDGLSAAVHRASGRLAGTRLRVGVSPHAPYTVRSDVLRSVAAHAAAHGLPMAIHASESRDEAALLRSGTGAMAQMFARRGIDWSPPGQSAVAWLNSNGALGPDTALVHGVQTSAADAAIVRDTGTAWVHCPKSNAKLGNGVAPLELLGPRVGIGTDSAVSNNALDMFEEMRFAALLQRAARRSPVQPAAAAILTMATAGSADVLGMGDVSGRLEAGMQADLAAVSLRGPHIAPAHEPIAALVYSARASDVALTVCGGVVRYDAALANDYLDRFPEIDGRAVLTGYRRAAARAAAWSGPS